MHIELVFLPDGGFYLHTGGRAFWTPGLDPAIIAILKGRGASRTAPRQVRTLETIVGPKGRHSSFISYYGNTEKVQTHCNFKHSHAKLHTWLRDHGNDHTSVQINLGLDGQFFALSNKACQYSGVDNTLQQSIQKLRNGDIGWRDGRVPEKVLFGRNGSHLVTCKHGKYLAMNPRFEMEYPTLYRSIAENFANKSQPFQYKYITLNPYVRDQWLITWGDGTVEYNLPGTISGAFAGVADRFQGAASSIGSPYRPSSVSSSGSNASYQNPPNFRPPGFNSPVVRPSPPVYPAYRPSQVPSVPSYLFNTQSSSPMMPSTPSPINLPTQFAPGTGEQMDEMQMLRFFLKLNQQLSGGSSGTGGIPNIFNGGGTSGLDALNQYNAMFNNGGSGGMNFSGGGSSGLDALNQFNSGFDAYNQFSSMFNGGGGSMGLDSAGFDPSSILNMGMGMGGMGFGC